MASVFGVTNMDLIFSSLDFPLKAHGLYQYPHTLLQPQYNTVEFHVTCSGGTDASSYVRPRHALDLFKTILSAQSLVATSGTD